MSKDSPSPLATKRIPSIDRFRGLVIICMILFQFAEHFKNLGKWATVSLHAPNENAIYILPNLSLADLVAPAFILAIGLTFMPSMKRRIEKQGRKEAVSHFLRRYLTLIGIGIAMNGINDILDGNDDLVSKIAIGLTALVLLFGVIALILKLAKVKNREKFYKVYWVYMCIVGVFGIVVAIINAFMLVTGRTDESYGHWLVLHHIGFAGLVAIPFALLPDKTGHYIRLLAGLGILSLYAVFHEGNLKNDLFPNNLELIDKVADGGFIGGFAWGAMLLLYLFFAEEFRKRKNKYLPPASFGIFTIVFIGLLWSIFKTLPETDTWAGALSGFLPINKGSVSPSYVLIATYLALLVFCIFELFNSLETKFDILAWWGKNPILMYCIEFGFVGALTAALGDYFETAPAPIGAAFVIGVGVLLTVVAYILDKKKIIIKL